MLDRLSIFCREGFVLLIQLDQELVIRNWIPFRFSLPGSLSTTEVSHLEEHKSYGGTLPCCLLSDHGCPPPPWTSFPLARPTSVVLIWRTSHHQQPWNIRWCLPRGLEIWAALGNFSSLNLMWSWGVWWKRRFSAIWVPVDREGQWPWGWGPSLYQGDHRL